MNTKRVLVILFLILTFIAGMYVTYNAKEPMTNSSVEEPKSTACPNLLIQKGNMLYLQDTNAPTVEGTNPIVFHSLDDYIKYYNEQRKKGAQCSALYLQQENNAQGEDVYRIRPSPFQLDAGLPTMNSARQPTFSPVPVIDANDDNKPYNANNYNGFDPAGLQIGIYTDLDKIHDSTHINAVSDNPMDPNWGGVGITQQSVDSGKYSENEISKPVLFNPKTSFDPTAPSIFPQPKDYI